MSYAQEDIREVSQLYQRLIENGLNPWMDTESILPGEEWKPKLMKAIREATVFIACLSANSVSKRGVIQEEIREALKTWEQKLPDDIYLIPLRLEKCEVPQCLSRFQRVDLFQEKGFNKLLDSLFTSIKRAGFTNQDGTEESQQNATRYAMMAIMSRNMSHNIGSHIISQLGDTGIEEVPRKKYAAFNSFLRTRLEFLATFSTPHLSSFPKLKLYRDVMAQFVPQNEDRATIDWQEVVINNISKAEGYNSHNITVTYIINGDRLSDCLDPLVICPDGYLGRHALYIILENIIRNSTKHCSPHRNKPPLEIMFAVNTNPIDENLIEVVIYDNFKSINTADLGKNEPNTALLDSLNNTIGQPLLGDHGSVRLDASGVTEMRICASFLRGLYPERHKEATHPPVLEATNIENNLAWRLYLRKG